jgi:hypothetical protein
MDANLRPAPRARCTCPHCHARVDWQGSDAAFTASAEYRICPECDEAVFVAWRSPPVTQPAGSPACEAP